MQLLRETAYNDESMVAMHDREINSIMEALNAGLRTEDVQKSGLTAQNLLQFTAQKAIYFGSVAASAASPSATITVQNAVTLLQKTYINPLAFDIYIDPSGITPGSPTLLNDLLSSANTLWPYGDARDKFAFNGMNSRSINPADINSDGTTKDLFAVKQQFVNLDSSAHVYYTIFRSVIVGYPGIVPS